VIRREIQDRGRQPVVEQDVAGEVAVDQLRSRIEASQGCEPSIQVLRLGQVLGRLRSPGDPIADRPRIASLFEE